MNIELTLKAANHKNAEALLVESITESDLGIPNIISLIRTLNGSDERKKAVCALLGKAILDGFEEYAEQSQDYWDQ